MGSTSLLELNFTWPTRHTCLGRSACEVFEQRLWIGKHGFSITLRAPVRCAFLPVPS
jgi:hypothetical protein